LADCLHALLEGGIELLRLKLLPGSISPGLVSTEPGARSQPEIGVRLEVLDHLLQSAVVLLLLAHQELSLVEQSGLFYTLLEPLVHGLDVLCNLSVLVKVVVGGKSIDSVAKGVQALLELLLLLFHLLDEVLLLLLQDLCLQLDLLHDSLWSTEQFPLVIVLSTCELVVELAADVVGAHAVINLDLALLDLDADLLDVLCSCVNVLDALWWLLDLLVDLIELGGDLVVLLDRTLCDELDLLLHNLLVFAGVDDPDILDLDLEDGHSDLLRDLLLELGLELSVPVDVGSQGLSVHRFISFVQFLDVLVWIEFPLLLELTEGLNILVQGLDGGCEGSLQSVVSLP